MRPRLALIAVLALGALLVTTSLGAAPPKAASKAAPAKGRSVSAPAKAKTSSALAKSVTPSAARRLQDIHIEGEIPVPQVLFITARDQRRFLSFQHRRYLRTSRELGETTPFPSSIALIRNQPPDAGKETPR